MANPVIVVVGAGPGLGASIARRFGTAGYDPALISRSPDKLGELGRQLQSEGFTTGWTDVDVTDADSLHAAVARFGEHAGSIAHVHFNPSAFRQRDALQLTPAELLTDLHLGVAALLTVVQAARPFMSAGARVTATGGATADRPWVAAASLGVQKAALRNLVTALDSSLSKDGIRALSITIDGTIKAGTHFDPALIADRLYEASQTDEEFWETEIRYDNRD